MGQPYYPFCSSQMYLCDSIKHFPILIPTSQFNSIQTYPIRGGSFMAHCDYLSNSTLIDQQITELIARAD